jgi:methyltransferase-like protein/SAM-dependent methyltransferase
LGAHGGRGEEQGGQKRAASHASSRRSDFLGYRPSAIPRMIGKMGELPRQPGCPSVAVSRYFHKSACGNWPRRVYSSQLAESDMAEVTGKTAYDEVPYHSFSFPETHPDRMATVAHLFGLTSPPVSKCRVLEIGCASGGNLAPMAALYPESQFIGIDLSARQIEDGNKFLAPLSLKNLELRHASVMDVNDSYGKFDYIISHGVYSWVPTEVQDKILSICHDNLTPTGVAYVSYNTLPGWHMRGMIRDMMRYHAMRFKEPAMRIGQARALLDFIAKSVGTNADNPYSVLLKVETDFLKASEDWYLYHEHLEEINAPVYFFQFIERAQAHGLKFLGESMIRQMVPGNYPKEVEETLQRLANDIIHMEQYMDFLRNRTFRQTLLCLPAQTPQYALSPDRLVGLHVASALKPDNPDPDVKSTAQVTFKMPVGNASVQITDPLCKNVMMELVEAWPASLPFEEVCLRARKRLNPLMTPDEVLKSKDRAMIGRMFLQFYMSLVDRLVELRMCPISVANRLSDKPKVTELARAQASAGRTVTNLKHELGNLGEFERQILRHLDGSHDKAQLADILVEMVTTNVLNAHKEGQRITDPIEVRKMIGPALDEALGRFLRFAFFID